MNCTICLRDDLILSDFYLVKTGPRAGQRSSAQCRKCTQKRNEQFRAENPEACRQKNKKYHQDNRERLCKNMREKCREVRLQVLRHYSDGEPLCRCCGEKELVFLAMDHIEGGGNKQRKEMKGAPHSIYRWLIKHGFPKGFQVLCHNCNMAKHILGACPHQKS